MVKTSKIVTICRGQKHLVTGCCRKIGKAHRADIFRRFLKFIYSYLYISSLLQSTEGPYAIRIQTHVKYIQEVE